MNSLDPSRKLTCQLIMGKFYPTDQGINPAMQQHLLPMAVKESPAPGLYPARGLRPTVVPDTMVLGTRVDGAVMVNGAGRIWTNEARMVVEEFKREQVNLFGIVLNRLTGLGSGYYHYCCYEDNGRRCAGRTRAGGKGSSPGWQIR